MGKKVTLSAVEVQDSKLCTWLIPLSGLPGLSRPPFAIGRQERHALHFDLEAPGLSTGGLATCNLCGGEHQSRGRSNGECSSY